MLTATTLTDLKLHESLNYIDMLVYIYPFEHLPPSWQNLFSSLDRAANGSLNAGQVLHNACCAVLDPLLSWASSNELTSYQLYKVDVRNLTNSKPLCCQ